MPDRSREPLNFVDSLTSSSVFLWPSAFSLHIWTYGSREAILQPGKTEILETGYMPGNEPETAKLSQDIPVPGDHERIDVLCCTMSGEIFWHVLRGVV